MSYCQTPGRCLYRPGSTNDVQRLKPEKRGGQTGGSSVTALEYAKERVYGGGGGFEDPVSDARRSRNSSREISPRT